MKVLSVSVLLGVLAVSLVLGFSFNWVKTPVTKEVNAYEVPTKDQTTSTVKTNKKQIKNLNLTSSNTVVLVDEINAGALVVASEISKKSNDPMNTAVYLLIDSPGGSVLDGAMVINAIEASSIPVYTVCMGICASMAAIIHQYGTERYMLDRSILMFHDAAGQFQGYFPHIKSRFDTIERYIKRFDVYISNRTGLKDGVLELSQHKELWIDSEDALSRKFTDKIVFVNFKESNDMFNLTKSVLPANKKESKIKLRW